MWLWSNPLKPAVSTFFNKSANGVKTGFKLSSTKSAAFLFTRKHNPEPISLRLQDGTRLPLKNEYRYLGLTFQRNRSYSTHIEKVVAKCRARLNVIRMLKGMSWDAGKRPLLTFYRSLVRSVRVWYGGLFFRVSQSIKTIAKDPQWCTAPVYWSLGQHSSDFPSSRVQWDAFEH